MPSIPKVCKLILIEYYKLTNRALIDVHFTLLINKTAIYTYGMDHFYIQNTMAMILI